MKILINALSALRGGGQTYIINLLKHLPEGNYEILLIVNSKNKALFSTYINENITIYEAQFASKSIIHRFLWEQFELPKFLKSTKANIYYAPGGIMLTKMPKGIVSATALRNMLPFDERERKRFPLISYIRFKLWLLRFIFLSSYKKSDKIVFISEYSKSIVKEYIPDIDKKSIVIPHGLNKQFLEDKNTFDLPKELEENKFYLYVSILDVYKAQKEVIEAWEILEKAGFEYPLVLVGPKYNEYGEEILQLIKEKSLEKKVIYLGKIDYDNLPSLYKSSRALIFASSCECCPNILLEKLSASKPVICSNIEPMPEFGKDAVVYFNPYNPKMLAEEIIKLEEKPEQMKELSQKAYNLALTYDWNITISKTIKFLINNKDKNNVQK
jgi:glycosyltransferase involved in cell wall biosynthesis